MTRLSERLKDIVPYVEPGIGSGLAWIAERVEKLEEIAEKLVKLAEAAVECAMKNLGAAELGLSYGPSPGGVQLCDKELDEINIELKKLKNELENLTK